MKTPVKARMAYDDEGQYLIFRTVCEDCRVPLTSRNRWRDRNLCLDHGKARDKERLRLAHEQRYQPRPKAARAEEPSQAPQGTPQTRHRSVSRASGAEKDPVKADLRDRLEAFLRHADNEDIFGRLQAGLKEFELAYRLRRVLPTEHRTIGLERGQLSVTQVATTPNGLTA